MRCISFALFLVLFSLLAGCVEPSSTHVLTFPERAWAYDQKTPSGDVHRFHLEPSSFPDSRGTLTPGVVVWSPTADMNRFYYADGAGEDVIWTAFKGHAYNWAFTSPDRIGFYLAGRALSTTSAGTEWMGNQRVNWSVDEMTRNTVTINWSLWGENDYHYRNSFKNGFPLAYRVEHHTVFGTTNTTRSNFTSTNPSASFPSLREGWQPVTVSPSESPFSLFGGWSFPFEEAMSVLQNDPLYERPRSWLQNHSDATLVEARYDILDENEGNATVDYWRLIFGAEGGFMQAFIAHRTTHPSTEMRVRYPLYDECPRGCFGAYGIAWSVTDNLSITNPGVDWPPTTPKMGEVEALLRTIHADWVPTGISWRLAERLDAEYKWLAQPEVEIISERASSTWDPEPQPTTPTGRLEFIGARQGHGLRLNYATGDLLHVQSPWELF